MTGPPREASLSFISPPSACPRFLLHPPSAPLLSSPAVKTTDHSRLSPSASPLSSLAVPAVTYQPLPSSSVSPAIYPPPLLPFMFWPHTDSDTSPCSPLCSNSISTLSHFFPLPQPAFRLLLSCSLQVAVHNDEPVFPPVRQPLTCILATTSPLAPALRVGKSKRDAGGMKNKHSRLSSSLHPFSHSFTRKRRGHTPPSASAEVPLTHTRRRSFKEITSSVLLSHAEFSRSKRFSVCKQACVCFRKIVQRFF